MIGPYSYEQYCDRVKEFHGSLAPGILVGGFMVEIARQNLPPDTLFDAICETVECLPDSVQLLTPCSVGNQWLRIIDVGRFAITFYDKATGDGVRVHLDSQKLEQWPAIKEWFMKLKPKKDQHQQRLYDEIREAGDRVCTIERLKVSLDFFEKRHQKSVAVCPLCNEAYRDADGPICPACKERRLPYLEQRSDQSEMK
jgi:formylmethanofuran dehydrogenase subunit E